MPSFMSFAVLSKSRRTDSVKPFRQRNLNLFTKFLRELSPDGGLLCFYSKHRLILLIIIGDGYLQKILKYSL